jgi:hypothetical protein
VLVRFFLHNGSWPVVALAALCACNRGDSASDAAAEERAPAAATGKPAAAAAVPVRTNTPPADDCGWLTAAEVEAVVGRLTGAPHMGNQGCVYPMPVDTETARRRAKALELQKKLEERFGKSDMPELKADESGVIVDVQVYDDPAGARAVGAAFQAMSGWLGDRDSAAKPTAEAATPPTLPGWDATNPPSRRSFHGKLGYMRISVMVQAAEVNREQSVALANAIRGKIADLPFPSERSGLPPSPDPCALLTAQEAEAVLGKLVVPPYRSDDGKPLAVANGNSCSYLTAGHHALVLHPTWEYGGTAYDATRMGAIVEKLAPALHVDAADTLDDGPWEEAGANSATGELYFLNGDRFLEVGYLTASTDMNGAVRLARTAMGRLGTGAAGPAASATAKRPTNGCPSVEQVGQAAGFPVTFMQSLGTPPDAWSQCHYEMTGRYRGNYLQLSRQPASRAEAIFAEMQQAVKAMKGADAKADRIALGSGGWAYGSNSRSEAAAVVGSEVWRANLSYMLAGDIGDQKEAMVKVLGAVAR